MSYWQLSFNQTQWSQRDHSLTAVRSVPLRLHWTTPSASFWGDRFANMDNNTRLDIAAYGFGVAALKEHSLMFGYSTLALDRTGKPPSNLLTDVMSRRRKDKWPKDQSSNTQLLHHWFYQLLGGWGEWLQPSTRNYLLCWVRKGMSLTAKCLVRYTAVWASVWWEPQWCWLEESDPLLLKGHFMNPLIYRQLKDTFTSMTYSTSHDCPFYHPILPLQAFCTMQVFTLWL